VAFRNTRTQTVDYLLRCQVKQEDIGVVSLYRQQLKLITSMLDGKEGVELLTADKSQGRDKECIIISMVRSNDNQQVMPSLKLAHQN
jgi:DNA replication ATP-dependent helicase Dna2